MRTALIVLAVAGSRADARPPAAYGALVCYQRATTAGASTTNATRLCLGAASDAPARCFEQASSELGANELATVRLCTGATSDRRVRCVRSLMGKTGMNQASAVASCSLHGIAPVPPPGPSRASCIETALDQTDLSELAATRLCRGARSSRPAKCVAWGEQHVLADQLALVALCAEYIWIDTYGHRYR